MKIFTLSLLPVPLNYHINPRPAPSLFFSTSIFFYYVVAASAAHRGFTSQRFVQYSFENPGVDHGAIHLASFLPSLDLHFFASCRVQHRSSLHVLAPHVSTSALYQ